MTTSPNGTVVSTVGPTVTDGLLNVWAMSNTGTQPPQISLNGSPQTSTGLLQLLLYYNGQMYQEANSGNWWVWTGTPTQDWLSIAGDPRTVPAPTPQLQDAGPAQLTVVNSIGNSGGNPTTPGSFPATLSCKYIRVWTKNAPTPPPPVAGGSALVGLNPHNTWSPTFTSRLGYPPQAVCGNGNTNLSLAPDGAAFGGNIFGWPSVWASSQFDATWQHNTGDPVGDPNAAASGAYNAFYTTMANLIKNNSTGQAIVLRVSREWQGPWTGFCPWGYDWQTPSGYDNIASGTLITQPAVWIAGFRNLVTQVRAVLPNIKISWDYPAGFTPFGGPGSLGESFYPGDAFVDIIGNDPYFDINEGTDVASAWNTQMNRTGGNLNDMWAFAQLHNKPMAFWEWGESFDGTIIHMFAAWMRARNVVAHCYWDASDGGNFTKDGKDVSLTNFSGADPTGAAQRMAAFIAEFGHNPGTTNFFGTLSPGQPFPGF